MFKRLILVAFFIGAACAVSSPLQSERKLIILQTNDLHGQALSFRDSRLDKEDPPLVGGLATISAYVKKVRREAAAEEARVLVVDCGDFFQGTPEGNVPKGRLMVDCMNEIGYDALCVGNHEFDFGQEVLRDLAGRAKFPILGANVIEEATGKRPPYLRDSVTFTDVGLTFVGLLTSDASKAIMPDRVRGLLFEREEETLKRVSVEGAVLLTHVGVNRERQLLRSGCRLLCGGHSHSVVLDSKPVPYIQSGDKGVRVGRIDWTGDRIELKHVLMDPAAIGEDPKILGIIERYRKDYPELGDMERVIGELKHDISASAADYPGVSSPLGNWLCDLMCRAAKADFAFHNRTGIRAPLLKGPIKVRDVFQVSPFKNTLVVMELSGAQVLDLLERMLEKEGRNFLEVGGLVCTYDSRAPPKKRMVSVTREGSKKGIDPDRNYRVVTNSFLAKGGDGFEIFTQGEKVEDTGMDIAKIHEEAIEKDSSVRYAYENRIIRK